MDLNLNEKTFPTPSATCTPVSVIKTKRLRPMERHETPVTIQFFTPSRDKENSLTGHSFKSNESPGIFMAKSFHNTGFTPKQPSLTEARRDVLNK